jgi:hypothetical protein
MAIFLSRAFALALLAQGSPALQQGSGDTIGGGARDTTAGRSWLAMGRAYLGVFDAARTRRGARPPDSVWTRALLDTADHALAQAAAALGPAGASASGDSARVLRVRVWMGRAVLAWERGGIALGPEAWGAMPPDVRLSPVLQELGENLLRACPKGGVLFTEGDADSYSAWYMRYAHNLRPDLLVLPWATWHTDSALRARVAADLKLGKRTRPPGALDEVAERRPVCATMAFARPPEAQVKWEARPLVWVAGAAHEEREGVSPRDFVFAALKPALEEDDPFAGAALALYAGAARRAPALCETLAAFQVTNEVATCRR